MFDFIGMFAPHLTRERIEEAVHCHGNPAAAGLFGDLDIPVR